MTDLYLGSQVSMTMNDQITKESTSNKIDSMPLNLPSDTMLLPEHLVLVVEAELLKPEVSASEKKRKLSTITEPVIASSSSSITHNQIGYRSIHHNVKLLVRSWGNVIAIHPSIFLKQLLQSRGYDSNIVPFNKKVQM